MNDDERTFLEQHSHGRERTAREKKKQSKITKGLHGRWQQVTSERLISNTLSGEGAVLVRHPLSNSVHLKNTWLGRNSKNVQSNPALPPFFPLPTITVRCLTQNRRINVRSGGELRRCCCCYWQRAGKLNGQSVFPLARELGSVYRHGSFLLRGTPGVFFLSFIAGFTSTSKWDRKISLAGNRVL